MILWLDLNNLAEELVDQLVVPSNCEGNVGAALMQGQEACLTSAVSFSGQ